MIIKILSFLLFSIFTTLGSFHLYWFFGGEFGVKNVIPTNENEEQNLKTPKFATLIVSLILFLFGVLYFAKMAGIEILKAKLGCYFYWIIPFIFILRAIGDFKYFGFFKKIKGTKFSKSDSKIFSPLCLFIGILGITIILLEH